MRQLMTKADAGRLGGTITLQRYGREWLRQQGAKGGRPRSQTYDNIRQRELRERNNNKEVKGFPGTGRLSTLKELYKARDRSSPIEETVQTGIAQVTPRGQVPAGKEARQGYESPNTYYIRKGERGHPTTRPVM